MSKFKKILVLVVSILALTGYASNYESLTFVKIDGSTVSFSVKGLIITYDDFAHVIITNDETSATLALSELDCMYFTDDDTAPLAGDVNNDGEVNIADINAVIRVIMVDSTDEETTHRADVNGDGEVNVADINTVIAIILGS